MTAEPEFRAEVLGDVAALFAEVDPGERAGAVIGVLLEVDRSEKRLAHVVRFGSFGRHGVVGERYV